MNILKALGFQKHFLPKKSDNLNYQAINLTLFI